MKILFVGSGEIGLPALRRLADRVVLVVTAPDKPAGRGLKTRATPVKELALSLNLPVLTTPDINQTDFIRQINQCPPDIILVAAFGQMIKRGILEIPGKNILNIHPSLLPKYRGAAPIERALLNRETETGVTVIRITERMDAGPILIQEKLPILPEDDAVTLTDRLAEPCADLTVKGIAQIEKGIAFFVDQKEADATYAPKIKKEEGKIDWGKDANEISAKVRAFVQWPHAYTFLPDSPAPVIIWQAVVSPSEESRGSIHRARGSDKSDPYIFLPLDAGPLPVESGEGGGKVGGITPGTVLKADKTGILVACGGETALLITQLQPAGKRKMTAGEFLCGHRPSHFLT
ncbi:MAG: methionyl-tRNA formyltransferase [Candidatus Omnitrophota bacterium]